MRAPVVVTRPLQQALPLAGRLREQGHEAVVFPLLDILPAPDKGPLRAALARLQDFALVVFVSPNAIDAALGEVENWPPGLSLAVVGEGSRIALANRGIDEQNARIFRPDPAGLSDSEGLLRQLDLNSLRDREVLVIRGNGGRELLSDAMRAAGARVEQVEAYRRQAPMLDGNGRKQLDDLITSGARWIITSSEALHNLVAMAQDLGEPAPRALRLCPLLVPHPRIAQTARELGFASLECCGSGDESIIATLQLR